jgi:hypothetical protein
MSKERAKTKGEEPEVEASAAEVTAAREVSREAGPVLGSAVVPNACPYRQAALLQQALTSSKMRVGFFLGAGCPLAVRVDPWPLIPDIQMLTDRVSKQIAKHPALSDCYDKILAGVSRPAGPKKTVEDALTRIRSLLEVVGDGEDFEGMDKGMLEALDAAVCAAIDAEMRKRLPERGTPYHQLAAWIGSIPRVFPVEIFTSNYDLLMEQALEESAVPYFDGFSGSNHTFFDVPSIEQLELPARWARLWKLHGSINWWKTADGEIQRRTQCDNGARQLIHPSHLKYDQSRKMPYLAMQDRLRAFLARGQAVLVTCGYSYLDWHINQAILDGLGGNPTAVCFGLVFGDSAPAAGAIQRAGRRGNLRLLAADGGILGTVAHHWNAIRKPDNDFHGTAVCDGPLAKDRTSAPEVRCKFCLGDFATLGAFLATQIERGTLEESDRGA